MSEYLNDDFAALDGVLLSYTGDEMNLRIPGKLGNVNLKKIGGGAFMESKTLRQVVLPEGIESVGKRAFYRCCYLISAYLPDSVSSLEEGAFANCNDLTTVFVYRFALDKPSYADLLRNSLRANGTIRLAHSFPEFPKIRAVAAATGVAPANSIPFGISRLFTSHSTADELGTPALMRNLPGLDVEGDEKYMTETAAFLRLITEGRAAQIDPGAEMINDRFLKTERVLQPAKTAVFTFDDAKTQSKDGRYYIEAAVRFGYHFWQSAIPVVSEGKRYFIYRRHYLSSDPDTKYLRWDAAVFSENRLITDPKEAMSVYAKYRFLSIL